MKVTKINVMDLVEAMEKFLELNIQFIDIELLITKNTVKFSSSKFEEGGETQILSA